MRQHPLHGPHPAYLSPHWICGDATTQRVSDSCHTWLIERERERLRYAALKPTAFYSQHYDYMHTFGST